ncbi:unnamed protein product [Trichogramma brassicae]|uniref:RNA-directed DNA polymerase n=1 Tax=Trichogramma brassicae TaxID=86971 RepID=A0A6H5IKY0_9HYME|nr:unnamed protein product [Trichogramma brassicae]
MRRRWQVQRDQSTKGRWTHGLIKGWVERRYGEISYHIEQLFTGHSYFKHHCQHYSNNTSARCPVCPDATENGEHVFFHCPRFERKREEAQTPLSERIKPENIVQLMLRDLASWNAVFTLAKSVVIRLSKRQVNVKTNDDKIQVTPSLADRRRFSASLGSAPLLSRDSSGGPHYRRRCRRRAPAAPRYISRRAGPLRHSLVSSCAEHISRTSGEVRHSRSPRVTKTQRRVLSRITGDCTYLSDFQRSRNSIPSSWKLDKNLARSNPKLDSERGAVRRVASVGVLPSGSTLKRPVIQVHRPLRRAVVLSDSPPVRCIKKPPLPSRSSPSITPTDPPSAQLPTKRPVIQVPRPLRRAVVLSDSPPVRRAEKPKPLPPPVTVPAPEELPCIRQLTRPVLVTQNSGRQPAKRPESDNHCLHGQPDETIRTPKLRLNDDVPASDPSDGTRDLRDRLNELRLASPPPSRPRSIRRRRDGKYKTRKATTKPGQLARWRRTTGDLHPTSSGPQLSGIYAGDDSVLKISIILGTKRVSAAVDTAATRNFIHPDWFPSDTKFKRVNLVATLAAKHQTMTITGTAYITMTINGRAYSLPVCIAPTVTEPLVLGIPWIREEKAIIDAGRNVLHFGKTQRQTVPFLQIQTAEVTEAQPVKLTTGFPKKLRREVDELFAQHAHVLSPHPGTLTRTSSITHKITLTENTTFRLPLYRYSEEKGQEIDRQIKEMLALDIIEPCISPYSSPIVLAKKRNGTWRFCVDYRKLNSLTEDTAQPIPRICDTLKDLGDSCVFSTLDLRSGYWQIPMDEKSKPLTAFATPSGGTYQFKVMPFGLKGAPGTFQRLISQEVLAGYMGDFCIGYLDDIIIHSKNYEEHLHHLSLVLERLSIHQLTCSPEKVRLGFPKLEFLGFNVTKDGNEAKEEYIREIQQVPPPTTIKQLQSFIGACNWLHEYIKDLAIALAPLTELLKKKTLKWTEEAQTAFEDIKKKFHRSTETLSTIRRKTLHLTDGRQQSRNGSSTLSRKRKSRTQHNCLRKCEVQRGRKKIPLQRTRVPSHHLGHQKISPLLRRRSVHAKDRQQDLNMAPSIQRDPRQTIEMQCMLGRSQRYRIADEGLWYFDQRQDKWKLSVPKDVKPRVLHDFHDAAGHPGEDETYRAIRNRFYWPNIRKNVRNHVKLCRICACGKKSKTSNADIRPHQPNEPWNSIAVDFMGPYPITARRKRFILVVTDLFSRWTEAFPMATSDTQKVIHIMEDEVFSRWGYPQSILSDNGPQFRSAKWQEACDKWQAKLHTTAIYSPRANPTERRNQEIKKGLRLHLMDQQQHQQWDLKLPEVLYNMRCRQNAATGHSPAYILFGKELNRPGDWKLTPNPSDDWKNDESSRLAKPRTSPFQIIAQLSEDVFTLNKPGNETKTHRLEMKPAEAQSPESPAKTCSNDDSTQRPESPADTSSNSDSTPSPEPPADIPSNADSTPSPVPPADTCSNTTSTQRSDTHPTPTIIEEEKEEDGSGEPRHRYNLRRRNNRDSSGGPHYRRRCRRRAPAAPRYISRRAGPLRHSLVSSCAEHISRTSGEVRHSRSPRVTKTQRRVLSRITGDCTYLSDFQRSRNSIPSSWKLDKNLARSNPKLDSERGAVRRVASVGVLPSGSTLKRPVIQVHRPLRRAVVLSDSPPVRCIKKPPLPSRSSPSITPTDPPSAQLPTKRPVIQVPRPLRRAVVLSDSPPVRRAEKPKPLPPPVTVPAPEELPCIRQLTRPVLVTPEQRPPACETPGKRQPLPPRPAGRELDTLPESFRGLAIRTPKLRLNDDVPASDPSDGTRDLRDRLNELRLASPPPSRPRSIRRRRDGKYKTRSTLRRDRARLRCYLARKHAAN